MLGTSSGSVILWTKTSHYEPVSHWHCLMTTVISHYLLGTRSSYIPVSHIIAFLGLNSLQYTLLISD